MKSRWSFLLGSILMLSTSSCATLIRGSSHEVEVQSSPPGAEVYVDGEKKCDTTPCKVRVRRKDDVKSYVIKKDGYHDYEYRDESRSSWDVFSYYDWAFFLVPGVVDIMSGANRSFSNRVYANLHPKESGGKEIVYVGKGPAFEFKRSADVDQNIPISPAQNEKRFAVIIGNEDYASQQQTLAVEANVEFARNDASAFKEYAVQVLGIPEKNIIFELDASTGKMNQALSKINLLAKNTNGEAEIFFYYAGHGLPEEASKEPYLIPVDVSGSNVSLGIKLSTVYQKLTEYPSKKVIAFIDACFSGGARNQGLVSARGIRIVPKSEQLQGNLLVLTASSGEQSSLAYRDKEHGIFTYFLLKKIQETKGKVSFKDLADYIKDKVSVESLLTNNKEQTPQVIFSPHIKDDWKSWKVKE